MARWCAMPAPPRTTGSRRGSWRGDRRRSRRRSPGDRRRSSLCRCSNAHFTVEANLIYMLDSPHCLYLYCTVNCTYIVLWQLMVQTYRLNPQYGDCTRFEGELEVRAGSTSADCSWHCRLSSCGWSTSRPSCWVSSPSWPPSAPSSSCCAVASRAATGGTQFYWSFSPLHCSIPGFCWLISEHSVSVGSFLNSQFN